MNKTERLSEVQGISVCYSDFEGKDAASVTCLLRAQGEIGPDETVSHFSLERTGGWSQGSDRTFIEDPDVGWLRIYESEEIWPDENEIQEMIKDDEKNEQKEFTNVVPFARPATGGDPPSPNWLSSLPTGTVFRCRLRSRSIVDTGLLEEYRVGFKTDRTVHLISTPLLNQQYGDLIVEPWAWTKPRECIEILVSNDEVNRTDNQT